MFRIGAILLVALAALVPGILVAQQADRPNDDIRVGDGWVYNRKDEITGFPIATFTSLVTEVSSTEIVTSAIFKGNSGRGFVVFDHDWNRLIDNNQKYSPHDGHGIHWPLAAGKEWRLEFLTSNTQTGANMKSVGVVKVVAQETVTTPAGMFETFKIDRQIKEFNTADPSRSFEMETLMWFAPQINLWVRRTFVLKQERRTRDSSTDELIQIVRKQ
jgi:hypothetical protein